MKRLKSDYNTYAQYNCYSRALLSMLLSVQIIFKDMQFKWTKVTTSFGKETESSYLITTIITVSTFATTFTTVLQSLLCIKIFMLLPLYQMLYIIISIIFNNPMSQILLTLHNICSKFSSQWSINELTLSQPVNGSD